jgi:tetratricopeptide (TPR) repeat protein
LLAGWDSARPDNVVLITADHGEGLGDGGEQTHGFLLHDGTLHIPMMLRGPGVAQGARVSSPVSQVDVAPTLLQLAGLESHPAIQGLPLTQPQAGRSLYSEALTVQFNLGLAPLSALTQDDGRYTQGAWGAWYGLTGTSVMTVPDASRDSSTGEKALAAFLAQLETSQSAPNALDADTLARLQALGYIGGDPLAEAGDVDPRDVIDLVPLTWRARQALARGRFAEAEKALTQLETRLAGTFGVDLLRAQQLRATGRRAEATAALANLYLRSPGATLALQLGDMHAASGAWAEARTWYAEALQRNAMSPEAMARLVRTALAMGEPIEPEALAERFLGIYPDHAELALARAEIVLMNGQTAEALAEAAWALQRMPRSPHALAVHARALWAAGEPDPAIDRLSEALRQDPTALDSRLLLVAWLLEVGRNAEAVRTIAPAARLLPDEAAIQALSSQAQQALEAELGH